MEHKRDPQSSGTRSGFCSTYLVSSPWVQNTGLQYVYYRLTQLRVQCVVVKSLTEGVNKTRQVIG